MNDESDSDWDSMSEAPAVAPQQQGAEVRYPPPSTQPKQQPETAKKMPADMRHPPPAAAPTPKPRPPASLPPPEAKADSRRKATSLQQEKQGHKKKPKDASKNQAVEETFSDLNDRQSYVDSGLGSSPEKDGVLRGRENPSYDGEDGEEQEARGRQEYRLPVPEERIALLPFDEMRTGYLQVELEDEGLLVDRVLPPLVHCCSRASAELLGLLKLPLIIIFVVLGQLLRVVVSSLLRPASDHLLKPLLVALHNLLLSPVFSLLYHLSRLVAAVLSPCCPATLPAPWRYIHTAEGPQTAPPQIHI